MQTDECYVRAPSNPEDWIKTLHFDLLIDGRGTAGRQGTPVINPSTENTLLDCPEASEDDFELAVKAAAHALTGWGKRSWDERAVFLEAFAKAVVEDENTLAAILTLENGKPLRLAYAEVAGSAFMIRSMASVRLPARSIESPADREITMRFDPIGIVGAICPWNVPIGLVVVKIAAALIAGNTIVVKPSPFTPLSALRIGQIARAILPPGVVNVVTGGPVLGRAIVEHPAISKLSFTGSTATGKDIARSSSSTLKRLTLELGGNDAAIVLADADIDTTASRVFATAFNSCGQFCGAVKRLFVQRKAFDPLVSALVRLAEAHKVGDGFDPSSAMGPIQNRPQYDRVTNLLSDALSKGGELLTGGITRTEGFFMKPSLVIGVAEGVPLVDEEQFGPVLPIIAFDDTDDAICRANATRYGLGASVWTRDLAVGEKIARQLDAGSAWVNHHGAFSATVPMPFFKESGLGIDYGSDGVSEYCQRKIINVRRD